MVNGGNIFLNQKIFMDRIWKNHKELFRYSKIYPEIYFIQRVEKVLWDFFEFKLRQ